MYKYILLLWLLSLNSWLVYSQPCKEERLTDQKRRDILESFILRGELANQLTKDKGVVLLDRSVDSLGRDQWYLASTLYDKYKNAARPPQSYYIIKGRVVLIWNEIVSNQWTLYRSSLF